VAEDAWRECAHDAPVVYGLLTDRPSRRAEKDWSCVGLSLDIYWPNSLIVPWWTMPWGATAAPAISDSAASGRQKEYPCSTCGRVQCRDDGELLLDTLVVSLCQLLGQVKGHLAIAIILKGVGGPVA
jgi:hypothetical protein